VHVLHDDIADHQVWAARAGAGHSLCSGVNRAGLKSILVEDGSQGVRYHPLVIDHQDAWLGGLAIVAGHNRYSRNLQTISKKLYADCPGKRPPMNSGGKIKRTGGGTFDGVCPKPSGAFSCLSKSFPGAQSLPPST